ncbi:delta [Paragonimus westermani]|uniref:Delta-like protein n=1 Tax=Paragonimus westermani TaxID=34504 RepID=A0A5J4NV20_9TREM|nr:delta [Paragonimus westermani]
MRYKFGCHKNYFGSTCNRFCEPHDSVLGHYKCDPQTGSVICNAGWTGTRCDEAKLFLPDKTPNDHLLYFQLASLSCMDGWEGSTCNECVSLPGCIHGQCKFNMNLADWEPYTCQCSPGWSGMLCNIDTQYCARHPMICQNGGRCLNSTDQFGSLPPYTCACAPGFRGTHCEHQIRNCDYHGCSGIGTCQPSGECICPPGHYGSRCQFNQTDCNQNPCIGQHSICVQKIEATLSAGLTPLPVDPNTQNATTYSGRQQITFECHCERGRFGKNCEYETNVCDTMQPCLNGGRCVSLGQGYQCVCPPKFTGDHCQLAVSACGALSCGNGGECLDGATRFTCHCPFGWTGPTCRENVNECAEVPRLTGRALCEHGAGCRDLPGSYQCLCPPDRTGPHCELTNNHTESNQRDSGWNDTADTGAIHVVHTRSGNQMILLMVILGTAVPVTGAILIGGTILLINNCRSCGKERRDYYIAKQTKFFIPSNEESNGSLYEAARVQIDRNLRNSMTTTNDDNEVETNKSVLCVHHDLPGFGGRSTMRLTENPLSPDSKSTATSNDPVQLSSDFLKLTTIKSQTFAQSTSLSDNTASALSDTPSIDRTATKNQYRATVRSDTPPPSYDELQWTVV